MSSLVETIHVKKERPDNETSSSVHSTSTSNDEPQSCCSSGSEDETAPKQTPGKKLKKGETSKESMNCSKCGKKLRTGRHYKWHEITCTGPGPRHVYSIPEKLVILERVKKGLKQGKKLSHLARDEKLRPENLQYWMELEHRMKQLPGGGEGRYSYTPPKTPKTPPKTEKWVLSRFNKKKGRWWCRICPKISYALEKSNNGGYLLKKHLKRIHGVKGPDSDESSSSGSEEEETSSSQSEEASSQRSEEEDENESSSKSEQEEINLTLDGILHEIKEESGITIKDIKISKKEEASEIEMQDKIEIPTMEEEGEPTSFDFDLNEPIMESPMDLEGEGDDEVADDGFSGTPRRKRKTFKRKSSSQRLRESSKSFNGPYFAFKSDSSRGGSPYERAALRKKRGSTDLKRLTEMQPKQKKRKMGGSSSPVLHVKDEKQKSKVQTPITKKRKRQDDDKNTNKTKNNQIKNNNDEDNNKRAAKRLKMTSPMEATSITRDNYSQGKTPKKSTIESRSSSRAKTTESKPKKQTTNNKKTNKSVESKSQSDDNEIEENSSKEDEDEVIRQAMEAIKDYDAVIEASKRARERLEKMIAMKNGKKINMIHQWKPQNINL